MREELERLFNEMNSKVDPDFNFEFEHWDNGNFDDSYEYGVEVGEEYTYREIVDKIKEILKNNTLSVEPKFTLELTKVEAMGLMSCLLKTSASGTDLDIGEMVEAKLAEFVNIK